MVTLWILMLILNQLFLVVLTQNPPGFINIDCGANGDTVDGDTGLTYISDANYTESAGEVHSVSSTYNTPQLQDQLTTLRSFPDGSRNCYTIKQIIQGKKYLVRAWFMYGNYDGKGSSQISFDLYLDSQLWAKLFIADPGAAIYYDILTIPRTNYLSVCLLNTNATTPFISILELRPLDDMIYPALVSGVSLKVRGRFNMGGSTIRYRNDQYDRIWQSKNLGGYSSIQTKSSIMNGAGDMFEVPTVVLQSAVFSNSSTTLTINLRSIINQPDVENQLHHVVMLFARFHSDNSTIFNVLLDGDNFLTTTINLPYLQSVFVNTTRPLRGLGHTFSLVATRDSDLVPILNALEVFTVINVPDGSEQPTTEQDFSALMAIKDQYNVKKNWVGDPCLPKSVIWEGLVCSYSTSNWTVIQKVNLSSSGLTGEITASFGDLTSIDSLDLSFNNLTGSIPDFLGGMSSLRFLNLSGNQLSNTLPPFLLKRLQDKSLELRMEGNPSLSNNAETYKKKKRRFKLATIIGITVAVVILLLVALIAWMIMKLGFNRHKSEKQTRKSNSNNVVDRRGNVVQNDSQSFTFRDLKKVTNNFEQEIGKGGFGAVYLGLLFDGTHVAVKVLDSSSHQGAKEFLAEVNHLSRVHHKNLVSLVGYCNDGVHMALVYEYMSGGSLRATIRGNVRKMMLSWEERLRILLEASQGISYLHCDCNPSIVHRDIKTENILLNQMLEAKIADFGLSKAFQNNCTHISTVVAGTPGYLDPEYHSSFQLNEKSDVYSFGVVMLEVLTAQPPIIEACNERIHIMAWVCQKLTKGNIDDVIDAKLLGRYDVSSAWKIVDLAMKCCARTSAERPIMPNVVSELKESLELVLDLKKTRRISSLRTSSSGTTAFEVAKSDDDSLFDGPSMR